VLYDVHAALTYENRGSSMICVQCHHARRDVANVHGQIDNGTSHFGPHGSPQVDMVLGSGSYEIEGYDYERSHWHQTSPLMENACVYCHMSYSEESPQHRVHSFMPSAAPCISCHAGSEGFDVNGLQTRVEGLMAELLDLIGVPEDSLGHAAATTREQRMAAYAYAFVAADGSRGVHNPSYAVSLLENAIDYINSLED
jgi:hypothetical protein